MSDLCPPHPVSGRACTLNHRPGRGKCLNRDDGFWGEIEGSRVDPKTVKKVKDSVRPVESSDPVALSDQDWFRQATTACRAAAMEWDTFVLADLWPLIPAPPGDSRGPMREIGEWAVENGIAVRLPRGTTRWVGSTLTADGKKIRVNHGSYIYRSLLYKPQ